MRSAWRNGRSAASRPCAERNYKVPMSQRRELQLIVAASTVASFVAAAGAMYFATWRFELGTNEGQVDRYSQFVERYVNEVAWQDHVEDVGTLASDMAREGDLRTAVLT